MFIVTDLTRFKPAKDTVCIAAINTSSGYSCIRPMPYLKKTQIKKLGIVPGAIIQGDFKNKSAPSPHTEDCSYERLECLGPCSSEEFEDALNGSKSSSLSKGFEGKITVGEKVIPSDKAPSKSIITLAIKPKQIEIVLDKFKKDSIRLHLNDNDCSSYQFLSITDLGFYNLAKSKSSEPKFLDELNKFIRSQEKVYLRVGLSRKYESPDGRKGFWVQINGIYTFPEFLPTVRDYEK